MHRLLCFALKLESVRARPARPGDSESGRGGVWWRETGPDNTASEHLDLVKP